VGKDRYPEFGLDDPAGKLELLVAGKELGLVIGGRTPGGGDRYALQASNQEVFAIDGDVVELLQYGDTRLIERQLQDFEPDAIRRLVVQGPDGAKRTFQPMPDKSGAWAALESPDKLDETAGNWLSKLERLSVSSHEEKPQGTLKQLVRVEYQSQSAPLGYLELYSDSAQTPSYWVRTDHLRWYGKVLNSLAEQLVQDLPSVLKR
jgi:hypothetical protein